jgi:hypothetical protein
LRDDGLRSPQFFERIALDIDASIQRGSSLVTTVFLVFTCVEDDLIGGQTYVLAQKA